ncbi:hypothetical protein GCK72_013169 [Caenorhabditis remanei]|uniref:Uncharacterized protein n=1 Tax=Caenorhabditis remanei TaxID=31234 RepID=A0A6A5GQB5_CAERE|nr:hypothetical protein GCK72_013169 [Caenorhabditis remanei]KAF1756715.1 hypothetical protein GCK72_013169 [Caenorhabditis remanei]
MNSLLSVVLIFSVAVMMASGSSISSNVGSSKLCDDFLCEVNATWKSEQNGDCFESTYHKKAYMPDYNGTVDPLVGVADCTKTPCGATEKVKSDCPAAFGEKWNEVKVL